MMGISQNGKIIKFPKMKKWWEFPNIKYIGDPINSDKFK